MARPGYPAYRNMLAALGCRVRRAAVRARDPLPADRRAAGRAARAAGRAGGGQPGQPDRHDGAPAELAAIAAWCDAHGMRLISDEIYHGITYGDAGGVRLATSRSASS